MPISFIIRTPRHDGDEEQQQQQEQEQLKSGAIQTIMANLPALAHIHVD